MNATLILIAILTFVVIVAVLLHEIDALAVRRAPTPVVPADDRHRGLYGKFIVRRVDGRDARGDKHEHCEYFVLDLDHDEFSRFALAAYAAACEARFPLLAADLRRIINAPQEPTP